MAGAPWENDPVVGDQPASKSDGGSNPWDNDPVVGSKGGGSTKSKDPTYGSDQSYLGQAGDFLYRAADTGTLGALDYANAGVHALGGEGYGDSLTKIQQQNKEWGENHPWLGLGADVAGYTLGAGKLGVGAKIAGKLGGSLVARGVGAGLENAGASVVSNELGSQGQASVGDLVKDAALSGTVGAATGMIPGAKGALAGDNPTPGLQSVTKQAFAPLKDAEFHPGDIGPAYDGAVSSISSGQKMKLDSDFKTKMNDISQELAAKYTANKPVTADDIASYSQALRDNASGKLEQDTANDLDKSLHGAMQNAPVGGSSPFRTGAEVSQAIKDAGSAAEQSNASRDLDNWIQQAQRGKAGSIPDSINDKLDNNPGFFQSDPNVRPILQQAAQPPGTVSKLLMAAAHPAADAAIGAGTGYLLGGQDLPSAILEGAAGGVLGAGVRHGLSQMRTNNLVNKLKQARYLNANPGAATPSGSAFKPGNRVLSPLATYAPKTGLGVGVSNFFDNASQ